MFQKYFFVFACFFLSSCSSYRMPGTGVAGMSGDTLCYRAAYAKDDPAIAAEIEARGLDCAKMLEQQNDSPF